jgi:hypothetical protein
MVTSDGNYTFALLRIDFRTVKMSQVLFWEEIIWGV